MPSVDNNVYFAVGVFRVQRDRAVPQSVPVLRPTIALPISASAWFAYPKSNRHAIDNFALVSNRSFLATDDWQGCLALGMQSCARLSVCDLSGKTSACHSTSKVGNVETPTMLLTVESDSLPFQSSYFKHRISLCFLHSPPKPLV